MTDVEIVTSIDHQLDEWTEHAKDYCDGTGKGVDELFRTLESVGFGHEDVMRLEYLSDPRVLERLPGDKRYLRRNDVQDVTLYMETMADVLETELV